MRIKSDVIEGIFMAFIPIWIILFFCLIGFVCYFPVAIIYSHDPSICDPSNWRYDFAEFGCETIKDQQESRATKIREYEMWVNEN